MSFGSLWFLGSWLRQFFPQLFGEEKLPSSDSQREMTEEMVKAIYGDTKIKELMSKVDLFGTDPVEDLENPKEELVRLLKSKNALNDPQTREILEKYVPQDVKKKLGLTEK